MLMVGPRLVKSVLGNQEHFSTLEVLVPSKEIHDMQLHLRIR